MSLQVFPAGCEQPHKVVNYLIDYSIIWIFGLLASFYPLTSLNDQQNSRTGRYVLLGLAFSSSSVEGASHEELPLAQITFMCYVTMSLNQPFPSLIGCLKKTVSEVVGCSLSPISYQTNPCPERGLQNSYGSRICFTCRRKPPRLFYDMKFMGGDAVYE